MVYLSASFRKSISRLGQVIRHPLASGLLPDQRAGKVPWSSDQKDSYPFTFPRSEILLENGQDCSRLVNSLTVLSILVPLLLDKLTRGLRQAPGFRGEHMPAKIIEKIVTDEVVLAFMRGRAKHHPKLDGDRFPVFEPYNYVHRLAYARVEGGESIDMEDDPDGFGCYLIYSLSDVSGIFIITAQQSMTSIRRAMSHDGWVVRCAPNWGNGSTATFWRNAPGQPLPVGYFKRPTESTEVGGATPQESVTEMTAQ